MYLAGISSNNKSTQIEKSFQIKIECYQIFITNKYVIDKFFEDEINRSCKNTRSLQEADKNGLLQIQKSGTVPKNQIEIQITKTNTYANLNLLSTTAQVFLNSSLTYFPL